MNEKKESSAERIDLKVILDNTRKDLHYIVMPYAEGQYGDSYDSTKVNGIQVPILQINNRVIFGKQIAYMNISFRDFLPTISLGINDFLNVILNTDIQGKKSLATVVLTTAVDGVYKKIKMTFYLTNTQCYDLYIKFEGVLKVLDFEKPICECWGEMSTFDFIKTICSRTGMGFSASPNCEEITDKIDRFFCSVNYKNAIQEHICMGGNENAVFDCWVDGVGNVNLVNLKHIYNQCMGIPNSNTTLAITPIDINDLKIKAIRNAPTTDYNIESQLVIEINRIITNYDSLGIVNLLIQPNSDNWIVNNSELVSKGSNRSFEAFEQMGASTTNFGGIASTDTVLNEMSSQGYDTTEYEFTTHTYLGEEMGEKPILLDTENNKAFLQKIRNKVLKVDMKYPNYGFTRGMVIGVVLFSNDLGVMDNMRTNQKIANINNNLDANSNDIEDPMNVTNNVLTLKGLFYIDDMQIKYEDNNVVQTLYLLPFSNLGTNTTEIKVQ